MKHIVIARGGALGDFILGLPLLDTLRESCPGVRITLIGPRSWLPLAWRYDGSVLTAALDDPTIGAMYAGQPPTLVAPASRSAGACPPLVTPLGTGEGQAPALRSGPATDLPPTSHAPVPHLSDPNRAIPANQALAGGPDLVLLLFRTVDSLFEAAWRSLEPDQILWYPPLPDPAQATHAVDHLLGVIDTLRGTHGDGYVAQAPCKTPARALVTNVAAPRIDLAPDEASAAVDWLDARGIDGARALVAIHPGSGGRWKCWPPERFGHLASMLADRPGAQILLVGGPADRSVVQDVRAALGDTRAVEADSVPLRHLAAILARCSLFVGNDSGVTHLAAAAGCPTLALFGPTDDRVWGPRGRQVTILRGVNAGAAPPDPLPVTWWRARPPEPGLTVDAVFQTAAAKLAGAA